MIELEGQIDKSTIITDFKTPLLLEQVDRNISRYLEDNAISQLRNIWNIYEILHPITGECNFFERTLNKIDCILGHKIN